MTCYAMPFNETVSLNGTDVIKHNLTNSAAFTPPRVAPHSSSKNKCKVNCSKCFSGDSTIHVKSNNLYHEVSMSELDHFIGHDILTYSNGEVTDNQLLTIVHSDQTEQTTFLEITTSTTSILITSNHLIYKNDSNKMTKVFADQLNVDDYLYVLQSDKKTITYDQIISINNVIRNGYYSPMPYNGNDFFVDNVLVSSYSSFNLPLINNLHYYYALTKSFFE